MALLDEQASGVHVISTTPFTGIEALALPAICHDQQPSIGLALRQETPRRRSIAGARARAPGAGLDAVHHAASTRILARRLQPPRGAVARRPLGRYD